MKYRRIYNALKRVGFSAFKAVEIIWDARRGDRVALNLIHVVRNMR